jgi:hypothetical protein
MHYLCCLQDIKLTTSRTVRYGKREICTGVWRKCMQSFGEETEMKEDHLEGVGVSGRTKVR